jgi:O-antigen ligase
MSNIQNYVANRKLRLPNTALWSYLFCISIAGAGGELLDRFGYSAALAFIIAVPVLLLGIRDFKVVCLIIVFTLPFVPTFLLSRNGGGFTGIRLMAGLLTFSSFTVFLSTALRPKKIVFPRLPGIAVCYLAVLGLAALNGTRFFGETPQYFSALGLVRDRTSLLYVYECLYVPALIVGSAMAAGMLAANLNDPRFTVCPVIISAVLFALVICYSALKGGISLSEMAGQESRRYLSSTGLHANEIGLTMNMAFAISFSLLLAVLSPKAKILMGLCTLIILSAVFFTFSRGAYLGTATIFIYFLLTKRVWRALKILTFLVIVGGALSAPKEIVEKAFLRTNDGNIDSVSSGRVDEIWRPLLPMLLENPVIGRGHGSIMWSTAAKEKMILPVSHPHSAYLEALLDLGVTGTLVVFAFLGHAWHLLWKLGSSTRFRLLGPFFFGASACIPALLVQGLTDDSFVPRYTHTFFWLAYGSALGVIARRERRRGGTSSLAKRRFTTIAGG